ncbi:MAG: hypothetical protein ACRDP6_20745 [Actinoallomurus sp.]
MVAVSGVVVGVGAASGGTAQTVALRPWAFGYGHADPAATPHITRSRTVVLRAHDFVATSIDNPPANMSQGDAIVVEGLLSGRNGDSAGRIDVNEVFTGLPFGGGARLLITATASLAAGQITAVGVGRVSQTGHITIKIPIAGGTGKYRNARGVIIGQPSASGSTIRLTFLLLP